MEYVVMPENMPKPSVLKPSVLPVTAPTMWNSLSVNTWSADSFASFKRRLKSEMFKSTYAT